MPRLEPGLSRLELQQKTPPAPGLGHGIEQAGRAPAARGEPAVEARVGFGPPQQRGEAVRVAHGEEAGMARAEDPHGSIDPRGKDRHAAGQDLLELPAGTRDGAEPYEECAAREIREETGMEAGRLEKIGEFYLAPGYSTEFMTVFLATDLKYNPLDPDEDEILSIEKIPVKEAVETALSGKLPDAKSLAALLLAKSHLEKYLD